MVAVGVRRNGVREVSGFDAGSCVGFLRQLVGRGLRGAQLVTCDTHGDLKRTITEMLAGVPGQSGCTSYQTPWPVSRVMPRPRSRL